MSAYGLEVYGTEGRMFWKVTGAWWLPVPHFEPGQDREWEPLELEHPGHYDPAKSSAEDYAFTEEYVRALDEGREHMCSGSEGRHVLEILMGIFESAAWGRPVDLPQQGREHPLLRWRAEAGLGTPAPMPRPYGEWLDAEDRRLGRG